MSTAVRMLPMAWEEDLYYRQLHIYELCDCLFCASRINKRWLEYKRRRTPSLQIGNCLLLVPLPRGKWVEIFVAAYSALPLSFLIGATWPPLDPHILPGLVTSRAPG